MSSYFDNLPLDAAEQLDRLSRLGFELREDHKLLLRQYDVESEDSLLELVRSGSVSEHPGYDHYLGACILAATREAMRNELRAVMSRLGG